ncbi:MAG TPA: Hsp20/alpha crystallin family protein [Gemmatimonadales bacterium]|nr:Hsp20/alpha crystallin family protein [Gemmatimonadales bacterium]
MKLMKPTPMMGQMKDEFDRVFERFFPVRLFEEPLVFEKEAPLARWTPSFDLVENEKEFVVRLEAPGVPRENLDIELTGHTLIVSGRRELFQEKTGETYLWQERETGSFRRTVRLPVAVLADRVEATYQDGILTIVLPKETPMPASRILIK